MSIIFRKELKRTLFGFIVWSLVVVALDLFAMLEFPVVSQYTDIMSAALSVIPRIGQLVFGIYNVYLNEPIGYYIAIYYWVGLVVFTHAIYTGASIISKESRDKTAEYIFTKPYKRSAVVAAKILTGLANVLAIGVLSIAMSLLGMLAISNDPKVYLQIIVTGFGMLITQAVLLSLGLLCSAVFSTYKSGARGGIVILIACYFMMFFVEFIDEPSLNFLSPLAYFSVSEVAENGLGVGYVFLAALVFAVCLFFTQRLYKKKAIV